MWGGWGGRERYFESRGDEAAIFAAVGTLNSGKSLDGRAVVQRTLLAWQHNLLLHRASTVWPCSLQGHDPAHSSTLLSASPLLHPPNIQTAAAQQRPISRSRPAPTMRRRPSSPTLSSAVHDRQVEEAVETRCDAFYAAISPGWEQTSTCHIPDWPDSEKFTNSANQEPD
jgi:hypothetical protein